ncbi:hypothetical protein O181_067823 [Austropuccinia psidii MF-1]|uniref:Uncharacterized protein n=1 Tax=Austropuccinia psidii MF-1 TaxID=1389203 RepID=A0A9Q3EU53_9BASI|nr:hypothetical protein [Austropuccinia psidii MF-1]
MVNTPGLCGKNTLLPNGLMTLGDSEWKMLLKKKLTILKETGTLHPDMSETMVHKRRLRKCGGDLEHAIRSRYIQPFSTEDYINAMEEMTTKNKLIEIGINPQ